jgi:hypothetical protein
MEYTAERRKKRSKGIVASAAADNRNAPTQINGMSPGDVSMGGQDDDFEDPYIKLARKLRNVRDSLNVSLPLRTRKKGKHAEKSSSAQRVR